MYRIGRIHRIGRRIGPDGAVRGREEAGTRLPNAR
jgi:hypothetical protein